MRKILIFSTEPIVKNRIDEIKDDVISGLAHQFINPLNIYIDDNYEYEGFSCRRLSGEKNYNQEIGSISFLRVINYSQIKKFSDVRLIKALTYIKNGIPNQLPNTLLFSCNFPISDIPKKDLRKFRIVCVS